MLKTCVDFLVACVAIDDETRALVVSARLHDANLAVDVVEVCQQNIFFGAAPVLRLRMCACARVSGDQYQNARVTLSSSVAGFVAADDDAEGAAGGALDGGGGRVTSAGGGTGSLLAAPGGSDAGGGGAGTAERVR